MKNLIIILVVIFISAGCSSQKELRVAEKQERQLDNSLEKQANRLARDLLSDNYEVCGLGNMKHEIFNYLKSKQTYGCVVEESKVVAPTDNIGKTKCLINIKGRVARMVCDSIRYRVDEATSADEANREYVDKLFSATEHLGIINLGAPDYTFTIFKKVNRRNTEYRMFAIYSPESFNNQVKNGIRFGDDIKKYIDKGLNRD